MTRTGGAWLATLLCAAATSAFAPAAVGQTAAAQASSPVVIDQVQLGDVFALQGLNVVTAPNGVTGAANALGNTAAAYSETTAVDYRATQKLSGNVGGKTQVAIDGVAGDVVASTAVVGNSGDAATCCGALTGSARQSIDTGKSVSAETDVYASRTDYTQSMAADASAFGNTQGWSTSGGAINVFTTQSQGGSTRAATSPDSAAIYDSEQLTATAVANNTTVSGYYPVSSTSSQTVGGGTDASVTLNHEYVGGDSTVAATATANNLSVTAEGGAAVVSATQSTAGLVGAYATANLDAWEGQATQSAYALGNSAIVANSGSYTGTDTTQTNTGGVSAQATFNGGSGYGVFTSSTAIGNAVSGYACPDCNGVLQATARQTSAGGVASSSIVNVGSVGSAAGASTAVGNSATFEVKRN